LAKPTYFMTCAGDTLANGDRFAKPWYNTMTRAEKLYIEVPGSHVCPGTNIGNKAKQGKYLVAFFSRWLHSDTRCTPFLCGTQRNPDRNNPSIVTEWIDRGQNGAGPRPTSDINTCVASTFRIFVTTTAPICS
jgi:hypothetical protein